jgi:hypothetical protein
MLGLDVERFASELQARTHRAHVAHEVDGAVSTYRWFYIVPQPGGGIVFAADGAGEVANQAAPTAG